MLGVIGLDSATTSTRIVVSEKQPATPVFNLQTNVCHVSEGNSNLAEAELHQCQQKPVLFFCIIQLLSPCVLTRI